jgi:hypothetical protein
MYEVVAKVGGMGQKAGWGEELGRKYGCVQPAGGQKAKGNANIMQIKNNFSWVGTIIEAVKRRKQEDEAARDSYQIAN